VKIYVLVFIISFISTNKPPILQISLFMGLYLHFYELYIKYMND